MHNPCTILDDKPWQFKMIESFIIVLYNHMKMEMEMEMKMKM